jgi:hypothetical protein
MSDPLTVATTSVGVAVGIGKMVSELSGVLARLLNGGITAEEALKERHGHEGGRQGRQGARRRLPEGTGKALRRCMNAAAQRPLPLPERKEVQTLLLSRGRPLPRHWPARWDHAWELRQTERKALNSRVRSRVAVLLAMTVIR